MNWVTTRLVTLQAKRLMVSAHSWGKGEEQEVTAKGPRGLEGDDGNVLKQDCGDGCTTLHLLKAIKLCKRRNF